MTTTNSGGGNCVGSMCHRQPDNSAFDAAHDRMKYKSNGELKTKKEIRREMNTLREQLGLPKKSTSSVRSSLKFDNISKSRGKSSKPRRSSRLSEKNARRSERIKAQSKSKRSMGARTRRRSRTNTRR